MPATLCTRMVLKKRKPSFSLPECEINHSPSLWVNYDGPGLVMLSTEHHSNARAIETRHINHIGHLAGPVDEAAVDVYAQVKWL